MTADETYGAPSADLVARAESGWARFLGMGNDEQADDQHDRADDQSGAA